LNGLAVVAINTDAFDEAQALGQEALAISRKLKDLRGIATTLLNLGMLAREDEQFPHAIELLDESLTLWRQLGDPKWIALATMNLGIAYRMAGQTERAEALLSESSELHARLGDRFQLAVIAYSRGHIEREAGRPNRANKLYAEALRYFDAVGARDAVVEAIEWIAVSGEAMGQTLPALRLFGAARAARKVLRAPLLETDARVIASSLNSATRVAGDHAEEELAAGAAMTLEQARDAALDLASRD
jgi:tetratricopeptide (TPR) repeat protein